MARSQAAPHANEERESSKEISVLGALWPFMKPYWVQMILALFALVLTASLSLTLPLAVRRVVDNFRISDSELLSQ